MKKFTKVRVSFDVESLLDFDQILHELQQHYAIGFAGLYKGDRGVWLYIQRDFNTKTCMTLGKISKICNKVAAVVAVEPFDTFEEVEEELIESFGALRHVGAKGHLPRKRNAASNAEAKAQSNAESNTESKNTTSTRSHNTTTTQSHNTTTTTNIEHLHLHINALGEEDVSHITKETLESFVGTADQVVRRLHGLFTPAYKHSVIKKKWKAFRRYARQKVRRWDEQERNKDPDYKSMGDSWGIRPPTYESEAEDDEYDHDLSKPPLYDPDSDSENNSRIKQELLRETLLEESPSQYKDDFLRDFEDWVYQNPHNSNVIASTKEGYFKYFDGKCWIKLYNKRFFNKVTASRVLKMDELLHTLVAQGELTEFCRDQVSQMVTKLFELSQGDELERFMADHTETTKDGILAAENQGVRLASVEQTIQRLIKRVGSLTTRGDVARNSTWEDLENWQG